MKIDRNKIHQKFNGRCAYCGCEITIKQMQVDHIIPQREYITYVKNKFKIPLFLRHLTESDVNHIDNLFPSCSVCNKWKTSFPLEVFRSEIFEQIKRLNNYSSNYRMAKRYGLLEETTKEIIFYFEEL